MSSLTLIIEINSKPKLDEVDESENIPIPILAQFKKKIKLFKAISNQASSPYLLRDIFVF